MQPDDLIQPFQLDANALRGRLVRLGPVVDDILARHAYPGPVAVLLGETLALCAALAATLKFDGVFSIQAHGDGPVTMLVADVSTDGDIRGYARYEPERLSGIDTSDDQSPAPIGKLLGTGYLAFTVDQGTNTELYQGIVALEGDTLADCVHHYFRQSEQLPTKVLLAVDRSAGGDWRAGALMVQKLPPEGSGETAAELVDDEWDRALALMGTCSSEEMLDPGLSPHNLLYRLFHEDGVRVYDTRPLKAGCRCSRDRIVDVLRGIGQDELSSLEQDGHVEVVCEFCNRKYVFDHPDLAQIFTTH
ncbi:MAG: Hsp33 family molecular chaperone HslO [Alphaproteobacteria bacterium]